METKELINENRELKRALAFCINQPLIQNLFEAIQRINNGEFETEAEFFKNSP